MGLAGRAALARASEAAKAAAAATGTQIGESLGRRIGARIYTPRRAVPTPAAPPVGKDGTS